jgi:hypothetical protein
MMSNTMRWQGIAQARLAAVRKLCDAAPTLHLRSGAPARTCLPCLLAVLFSPGLHAQVPASTPGQQLKLLISVRQQAIPAPYPATVTLHLHNAGPETLWLYRRARNQPAEGASLQVRLEPAGAASRNIATPARGVVFESVGLPRPRMVRLLPSEDYTETTSLKLVPALVERDGQSQPLWGRYRLAVTYRAHYSNAQSLERVLGLVLWQGAVTSNTVGIELQSPRGQGSVAGTVMDAAGRALDNTLVSLTDEAERRVDQMLTDSEGRFSFDHLPLGLYWATARRPDLPEDTVVFRHVRLTPSEPAGAVELVILRREIYRAEEMLHKPVLFRVTDHAGRPLADASLQVLWSDGQLLEKLKSKADEDGIVALQLIPGSAYVTLKQPGCPEDVRRLQVAEGEDIDGFRIQSDCGKK